MRITPPSHIVCDLCGGEVYQRDLYYLTDGKFVTRPGFILKFKQVRRWLDWGFRTKRLDVCHNCMKDIVDRLKRED